MNAARGIVGLMLAAVMLDGMPAGAQVAQPKDFGAAVALLREAADVIELRGDTAKARVAVSPSLQGRVMTSTFGGMAGPSLGWIYPAMIRNPESNPQFNNYGGEERFWIGPEGGQFSLYFHPGAEQTFGNWYVPPAFNEGAFSVVRADRRSVTLQKEMRVRNWSGAAFHVLVTRDVAMVPAAGLSERLGITLPAGVDYVGYETVNRMRNLGDTWRRETGLLGIWILSMFNPSAKTVVVAPYKTDAEGGKGPVANTVYFGALPPDRFVTCSNYVAFLCDGRQRGKFGIPVGRARDVAGSIDFQGRVLTIAKFSLPGWPAYVNSLWKTPQADPFAGDVMNSYNDGPVAPGQPPLGPFYEIESNSPAYELGTGATVKHVHQTYHFRGDLVALNQISRRVLGVDLDEVKGLFQ